MTRDDGADPPAVVGAPRRAAPTAPARSILVVDDEPDSLDLLCAILAARGHSAIPAQGGAEALQRIGERIPDLILLDVMMPQMSGLQLLEHLRRSPRTARIPIILVTAKRQDDDVIIGYQLGADYYITKPCTAAQLMYGLDLVWSGKRRAGSTSPRDTACPPRLPDG
jgi:CheY-like chemotaxis protein